MASVLNFPSPTRLSQIQLPYGSRCNPLKIPDDYFKFHLPVSLFFNLAKPIYEFHNLGEGVQEPHILNCEHLKVRIFEPANYTLFNLLKTKTTYLPTYPGLYAPTL